MAILYAAIVTLCLFESTFAQIISQGKCQNITKGLTVLDVNQVSNGTWYEVRKYPTLFELSSACNVIKFKPNANNSIDLVDDYESGKTGKNVPVFFTLTPSESDPSLFFSHFPYTPDGVETKCWFLAADYNGCLSAYCCTDGDNTGSSYTWVICRDPKPDKSQLDPIYKAYDDNNIETNSIVTVKQKNCPTNPLAQ